MHAAAEAPSSVSSAWSFHVVLPASSVVATALDWSGRTSNVDVWHAAQSLSSRGYVGSWKLCDCMSMLLVASGLAPNTGIAVELAPGQFLSASSLPHA